jgi:hypothetical protein
MNYGFCHVHNKGILKRDNYGFMCDLIFYIIESANNLKTKIIMLDIAKKFINIDPTIDSIHKIQHYFFRYYHYNNTEKIATKDGIYLYYGLELPPENWIEECVTNKVLF